MYGVTYLNQLAPETEAAREELAATAAALHAEDEERLAMENKVSAWTSSAEDWEGAARWGWKALCRGAQHTCTGHTPSGAPECVSLPRHCRCPRCA